MSTYTKETYSEVCEFLGLLGAYYISKLPNKLVELFEENKSEEYVPHIKTNIPIKDQSLSEDTLAIIAVLNLQYWCEDENEIKRLKEVYKKMKKNIKEHYKKNIIVTIFLKIKENNMNQLIQQKW